MTNPDLDMLTVAVQVDRSQLGDPDYVDGVVRAIADQARRKLSGADSGDVDTIAEAVREAAAQPGRVVTVRP